jgi:neutral ceramidase
VDRKVLPILKLEEIVSDKNFNRREFLMAAGGIPIVGNSLLRADSLVAQAGTVKMFAGTARVDVTPDKPRVCANGRKPDPPTVYHPIHARCLTLHDGQKRLVLVTYDFNCLDVATPILRERVERELSIPPSQLILLATHNHQSPIQIVPDNFDYGRWLAEKIFGLIKEAIAREEGAVSIHFGFGQGHFIRASGSAHADYDIQVLRVMKGNKPIAVLFNHPTHPLSGPDGYGPSHPGYAMDELEQKLPGALALYADGCGGNQFCFPPPGVTDPLAACKQRGHELAEAVSDVLNRPMEEITGQITSQLKVVDLPLAEPLPYNRALELARGIPLDIGFVPFPDPRRPSNWIRALIQHYKEGIPFPTKSSDYTCTDDAYLVPKLSTPRKYECRYEEVVAAKIGRLNLIAIQGEPCAPIGARIKDVLRQKNPTMVFGYFAEHNLYIPTREIVRQDAYQSQVIRIQYASHVGWAPEVEDEMVKAVLALYGEEIWERRRART